MRAIVSQGPDFDKYEKYKQRNTYNDRVGVRVEPKKSVLGAYAEPNAQLNLMNDRDALYEQLAVPDAIEIGRKLGEFVREMDGFICVRLSRKKLLTPIFFVFLCHRCR